MEFTDLTMFPTTNRMVQEPFKSVSYGNSWITLPCQAEVMSSML